jgi:epsilon-lactone hydrolase
LATDESQATLHLAARDVPVPLSVSSEAQALLSLGPLGPAGGIDWPPLDDLDAWRSLVLESDKVTLEVMLQGGLSAMLGMPSTQPSREVHVEDVTVGEARVFVASSAEVAADDRRVYLDMHGGGMVFGAGDLCRHTAIETAQWVGAQVWSVDYRMPPDHPYPTAVDDCLAVYRALLEQHDAAEIIVGGGSAGGNLAAALVLRARDEGLPLPAAAVLITPGVDLTGSGDSWHTNLGLDWGITGSFAPAFSLYIGDHDPRHPYISPLYGDFSKGFPPTILTSGTRDLLLSDTVRMHRVLRSAGIPADLHVWEAASHAMFMGVAPEDAEHKREIRRFVDEHWPRS